MSDSRNRKPSARRAIAKVHYLSPTCVPSLARHLSQEPPGDARYSSRIPGSWRALWLHPAVLELWECYFSASAWKIPLPYPIPRLSFDRRGSLGAPACAQRADRRS